MIEKRTTREKYSDRKFYREYLKDHPDRDYSPFMIGIAAAATAGGGYLLYRKGYAKGFAEKMIQMIGSYRSGEIQAINSGFRTWTEREFTKETTWSERWEILKYDVENAKELMRRTRETSRYTDIILTQNSELIKKLSDMRNTIRNADKAWDDMEIPDRIKFYKNDYNEFHRKLKERLDNDFRQLHNVSKIETDDQIKRTGYRYLTVGDILDLGLFNVNKPASAWTPDDEFINAVQNELVVGLGEYGKDFRNKIFDYGVLINNETKKIADFRDFKQTFAGILDSIADDFTIPFVKINPLRMFYLNQFSSIGRNPAFKVLGESEYQPTLTKSARELGKPMLYSNNKIYDFTNLDNALFNNVRLSNAKAGPMARYFRNLAGLTIAEYQAPSGGFKKSYYNIMEWLDIGFQDEPIGRDIGFYFRRRGSDGTDYMVETPGLDMTTWPSWIAKRLHRWLKPYEEGKRIYLDKSFGETTEHIVVNNMKKWGEEGFWKQFSPMTGRKNLEDVTTPTFFMYAFFERLNATLNQVGLGLSNDAMGSAFDVFKNLMVKRILPVYGVVEGWDYLNTVSDQFLGFQPEDMLAKGYAKGSIQMAGIRDLLGITDWAKDMNFLMPGGEQIADLPLVGRFFDLNETMEETKKYWESGEEAIRRGRFWEFGNTPFTGAKIDYFRPNWVRTTLSDWKFTDTLYGSREEYFDNRPYPTPTSPLAPIRYFLTDKYHYEEKHYYDRPYMATAPIGDEVPLIGPLISSTIGGLLKPERRMHQEYWDMSANFLNGIQYQTEQGNIIYDGPSSLDNINTLYDPIAERAAQGKGVKAFNELFQAAGISQMYAPVTSEIGAVTGDNYISGEGNQEMPQGAAYAAYTTPSGQTRPVTTSADMIRSINYDIKEKSLRKAGGAEEYSIYDSNNIILPSQQAVLPSGLSNTAGNLYYNLTEMGGFYGFATSVLGPNSQDRSGVVQDAGKMTSLSRSFWDMNIGNLGGDANEIFRRFLPRDVRRDEYNPIPNTMPSWLPGSNYFINFQAGDPYIKVPMGEMRLPGEAYERLYNIDSEEIDKRMEMQIGASFIGKDIPEIVNHMLQQDKFFDDEAQYILKTGEDWHEKWETSLFNKGIILDYEQYMNNENLGISGFYDAKVDQARWLEYALNKVDVFKYYQAQGGSGADRYGGFYDEGTDILALRQSNPEAFRQFISDSLSQGTMAIVDPKTMSSSKYSQDEMFFKNVQQVNFYLHETGLTRGYLLHVNREQLEQGKEEFKLYAFDYNPEMLEYSYSKVQKAREYITEGLNNNQFGRADFYDQIDRFRILADVAPYSDEYRELKSKIRETDGLTEEQVAEISEIEDQVSARKKNLRVYDYRFTTANIEKKKVTVREVIDNNTFYVEEFENPITLAGVRAPSGKDDPEAKKARSIIGLDPGDRVSIGIDEDEVNRIKDDTYQSIGAVLYNRGININKKLIDSGVGKEKENDFSPAGVNARFTGTEIRFGKVWEMFAHMDTPYNTKFLQVRSPLEQFERREVYGKDWQDWSQPVEDFAIPWYQNIISKNPIVATLMGAFIGMHFGNTGRYGYYVGAAVGGISGLLGSLYTQAEEVTTGERWVPERRLKEREMFEYMDALKYVKFRRLYEYAADKAQEEDNFNVREFIARKKDQGDDNDAEKQYLMRLKRKIRSGDSDAIAEAKKAGFGEESGDIEADINAKLNTIRNDREVDEISPWAAQALAYYQESEKTMMGYDPGEPLQNFLAALPKKERDYLVPFIKAPEEERDEILQTVPEYMKRVLQTAYGMKADEKPDLVEYFMEHELPDADWIGWDDRGSLNDVKVKLVKKNKLDPSEFDIWKKDVQQASYSNVQAPDINKSDGVLDVRRKLNDVLQGIGLENVNIEIAKNNSGNTNINMNIYVDRRKEVENKIRNDAYQLM